MLIKVVKDVKRGDLAVVNLDELPFNPMRCFTVFGMLPSTVRGTHAHKTGEQLLLCLAGEIILRHHDGVNAGVTVLEEGDRWYMPPMMWCEQQFTAGMDILQVFCSDHYDPSDYINDFDEFLKIYHEKDAPIDI